MYGVYVIYLRYVIQQYKVFVEYKERLDMISI